MLSLRFEYLLEFTLSLMDFYSSYLSQKFLLINSLGTFGFWSAFLKGRGDVISVTGTSSKPEYIEPIVRQYLPNWKFIQVSISSTFYAHILCQYFGAKNYKAETRERFVKHLSAKKCAYKMLMKLTTGSMLF